MTCYQRLEFLGDAILDFCEPIFDFRVFSSLSGFSGHPPHLRPRRNLVTWCPDVIESGEVTRHFVMSSSDAPCLGLNGVQPSIGSNLC